MFVSIYDIESVVKILQLSASTIGLSLSKSWMIIGTTQWLVRKSCECENNLTSLERVLEYSMLPDEETNCVGGQTFSQKPIFSRTEAKKNLKAIVDRKFVKTEQLQKGNIEMQKFVYGYENNEQVLKEITFSIIEGEKIGIVGRTGKAHRVGGLISVHFTYPLGEKSGLSVTACRR